MSRPCLTRLDLTDLTHSQEELKRRVLQFDSMVAKQEMEEQKRIQAGSTPPPFLTCLTSPQPFKWGPLHTSRLKGVRSSNPQLEPPPLVSTPAPVLMTGTKMRSAHPIATSVPNNNAEVGEEEDAGSVEAALLIHLRSSRFSPPLLLALHPVCPQHIRYQCQFRSLYSRSKREGRSQRGVPSTNLVRVISLIACQAAAASA